MQMVGAEGLEPPRP